MYSFNDEAPSHPHLTAFIAEVVIKSQNGCEVRWKIKPPSMAYLLSNICTKNYRWWLGSILFWDIVHNNIIIGDCSMTRFTTW